MRYLYLLPLMLMGNIYTSSAQYPGNVSSGLRWLKADALPTNMVKQPVPGANNLLYLRLWTAENDSLLKFDQIAMFSPTISVNDPQRKIGSYAGVLFQKDSMLRYMQTTGILINSGAHKEITVYCVNSINGYVAGSDNPLFATKNIGPGINSNLSVSFPDKNGRISWMHGMAADTLGIPFTNTELTVPYLWTFHFSADSATKYIKRNGLILVQKSGAAAMMVSTPLSAYLGYNSDGISADYANANIGELLIYQVATSSLEKERIESYLAFKFGITLDQAVPRSYIASDGTTMMWNATLAGLYKFNIAGVGFDNASRLVQKQNQSVNKNNGNNIVSMGFNSIAFSNPDNNYVPGLDKDRVFYTWSDDGDSINSVNNNDLPATLTNNTCAQRLKREWLIQRTLSDTNALNSRKMQVTFDMNNAWSIGSRTKSNFSLLIDQDGDGDFATGIQKFIPATNISGNIIAFDTVSWDTDKNGKDVFTLIADANIQRPVVSVMDTFYAISGDRVPIMDLLLNTDLSNYSYQFYNNGGSLIYTSGQGRLVLTESGKYYVTASDNTTLCTSEQKAVVVIFREILKTWKEVVDETNNKIVAPNEILTYKIYVVNVDTIVQKPITSISISDPIPENTTYVSNNNGATLSGNLLIFNFQNPVLMPGDTLFPVPSFQVRATADLSRVNYISNMANVQCMGILKKSGCDPHNSRTVCGPGDSSIIYVENKATDVIITKVITNNTMLLVGNNADFDINVVNAGQYEAVNIQVEDTLAPNLGKPDVFNTSFGAVQYEEAPKAIRWIIPSLDPGQTVSLRYACTILFDSIISNTARLSMFTNESNYINNVATVTTTLRDQHVPLIIPNIITPNADGKNDRFVIPQLDLYPASCLTIFNRWGSIIYESNDYKNDWEGAGLDEGTYYYILKTKDVYNKKVYKGWIELIRGNEK